MISAPPRNDAAIIGARVGLARMLNLDLVVEGGEAQAQREYEWVPYGVAIAL